ncbi:hypothetical protein JCM18899A_16380 [Nocardioides sp. AN3]
MNPPTRLPAAAPRRVRDRIALTPDGPTRIIHRSPHSLYLEVAGWCVGVVDAAAVGVPCALRVTSLAGVAGDRAHVEDGVLHLDGTAVAVGRIVDVAVPLLRAAAPPQPAAASAASSWVAGLIGAGEGLTPYGDDVLCGWLAIHRAAGVATPPVDAAVRRLLPRTTLLSATLLDCAMRGEVMPEFAAWVRHLGTSEGAATAAALEAVGHTSGRGLLEGGRRALIELGLAELATGPGGVAA